MVGEERPRVKAYVRLMELATAYWPAAALMAAVELGVFERLTGAARSAGELAREMSTDPRMTDDLLRALAAFGVLERRGTRYQIAKAFAPFLRVDGEGCLLDALRYNCDLYPLWGRLAETIRSGTPAAPAAAHLGGDPERVRRFVLGMRSRARAMAERLLPVIRFAPRGTLLDLGSGPGLFSQRLAERHPELQVILFDLPPVLEAARPGVEASSAAPRIHFHPGDYRRDALPGPVDAVLFCGALHQESEASARSLFRRIRAALKPGGALTVVDLMRDDAIHPAFATLFSLNMKLFNPEAGVFEGAWVARELVRAGFEMVRVRAVSPLPYRAVTAVRPPLSRYRAPRERRGSASRW